MSPGIAFYLTRADECARDAESAKLDNVRDRCRRSESAWREMADRLMRTETMRAQKEEDRAAAAALA
jgi:transcription elongation GreA/GreB family factor